jgi:hypothetical protein
MEPRLPLVAFLVDSASFRLEKSIVAIILASFYLEISFGTTHHEKNSYRGFLFDTDLFAVPCGLHG